jgi:hypothetical protein
MPPALVFLVDRQKVEQAVIRVLTHMTLHGETSGDFGALMPSSEGIERIFVWLSCYRERAMVEAKLAASFATEPPAVSARIGRELISSLWRLRKKPTAEEYAQHAAPLAELRARVLVAPASSSRRDDRRSASGRQFGPFAPKRRARAVATGGNVRCGVGDARPDAERDSPVDSRGAWQEFLDRVGAAFLLQEDGAGAELGPGDRGKHLGTRRSSSRMAFDGSPRRRPLHT